MTTPSTESLDTSTKDTENTSTCNKSTQHEEVPYTNCIRDFSHHIIKNIRTRGYKPTFIGLVSLDIPSGIEGMAVINIDLIIINRIIHKHLHN